MAAALQLYEQLLQLAECPPSGAKQDSASAPRGTFGSAAQQSNPTGGGVRAAVQLPKGIRSLAMQTFALCGLPVYVPLTIPCVSVALTCPGTPLYICSTTTRP